MEEGEEEDELAFELLSQLKATSSAALPLDSDSKECSIGTLLMSATIDVYIAGVAELHHEQHSLGLAPNPTFRGPALQGLLQSRYRAEGSIKQHAYTDRGASGITAGYTEQEFLHLQEVLLRGSSKSLTVSPPPPYRNFGTNLFYTRIYKHESTCFRGTILYSAERTAGYWSWRTCQSSSILPAMTARAQHPVLLWSTSLELVRPQKQEPSPIS